jgi:anionic cell wall polymer biosynthesis LytR-Cps2A-Psr (LCP) family protein
MKNLDTPTYQNCAQNNSANGLILPLTKEDDTLTNEDDFYQKQELNDLFSDTEKKMDMAAIMGAQKLFQVLKNILRKRFQWFIKAVYENTRHPSMFTKIKNSIAETNSVNKKKLC